MSKENDPYKQKFRPDTDPSLESVVDDVLGDLDLDQLYQQGSSASTGGESPNRPEGGAQEAGAVPAAVPHGARRGRVMRVGAEDVFVDFGGKSEGVASLRDFEEPPKVGDELDFYVQKFDAQEGLLILTRKGAVAGHVTWDNLEVGQVVEAVVTGVNKGGLELTIKQMRAFMPAGQVDLYFQEDLNVYLNQKMTVEVTQFDRAAKNLVVSRRNILEQEKQEQKQKTLAELAEGQVRRGTVRSVMDFGAFVDLGGVDGLLHVSEMTFKRGRHSAGDFVKVGDVLDVKVLKIDRESGKLSLSLKQAHGSDPWLEAESRYAVGTGVTGRVTKVESFGAFIEVEEGLEGLLPVSEISWQRIGKPSDVVHEGDTLKLVVISLDAAQHRISFSLKQAGPDPWASVSERYAVDMVVDGVVTRTADFGAFVELEPGLEGLVHISELADQRVATVSSVVKQGDAVKVRILEINKEARRISLSIKRAHATAAASEAPATSTAAPAVKKKRPELRGGLDFNFSKNK